MPTTSLGIRYPTSTDQPNGPLQMKAIADDVNGLLLARGADCCRLMARVSSYNIPDSTWSAINGYDGGTTYNVGNISYGAGIFTVGTAGFYLWGLTVAWPSMSTSAHLRGVKVEINSSTVTSARNFGSHQAFTGINTGFTVSHTGAVPLAAGDQVQAWFYQNSGATVTATPTAFYIARVA